jgi:flagellar hook-associated protein 1 FlgK
MTINSILWTATSALSANQSALGTTSQNVTNVNNPDYVRRQAVLQSVDIGGTPQGVKVAEIKRIAAEFLARESLSATSTAGTFDQMQQIENQLQSLLGAPSDQNSVPNLVNQALAYPSTLTLDPTSIPSRLGYLQTLNQALGSISGLATQVQGIRADADSQVSNQIQQANTLIKQIHSLNEGIAKAKILGSDSSDLQDQRAAALRQLSGIMSISTYDQPDGSVSVTTSDGYALVTDTYAKLSYTPASSTDPSVVYGQITAQHISPANGQPIGTAIDFASHIEQGSLRGLLSMRDVELPNLLQQLGNLGANFADKLNAAHNDSISVPPQNTLTGRDTGLLATDAHGFTGTTTIAVVDSTGALVRRVDLDFTNGTYSFDAGGGTTGSGSFAGNTIGDVVSAINTALGGDGSASFNNGVLQISATNASDGIGFSQPSSSASDRGGQSFSQVFGLNDLVTTNGPTNFNTGITSAAAATTSAGFTAGQSFTLSVRSADGSIPKTYTYTATGGETLGDVITALNNSTTGLGAYMTFALDSSGHLSATPTAGNQGATVAVKGDDTTRGGTGVSFTELFGVGQQAQMKQALGLQIAPAISNTPTALALAKLDISPTTTGGDIVATAGNTDGAIALTDLNSNPVGFAASGDLSAMNSTVGNYASLVVGNASTKAASIDSLASQADSVKTEVDKRRAGVEGVNLDEELSNMVVYQQAYNAAARLVTVAQRLYDTLLQTVPN